ncbi:MAG: type II toxin-antitoxin system VapC family toxin [Ornithinimicrobium sp.]
MSVSAVLDCSVVVDLLVSEDQETVMSTLPRGAWHIPDLLDIEVISALCGLHLGRHLTIPRVDDALRDYTDLAFTRWSAGPDMRSRIFALGGNLTAYDATYVALAEGLELPLITRDKRMASSARRWVTVQTL